MILIFLLQASLSSPMPDDAWVRVSARDAFAQSSTTIDFIKDRVDTTDGEYTLRLITRTSDGMSHTSWATSRTCSGVREAVEQLRSVPFPAIVSPEDRTEIVVDGMAYSVIFSARYGSQYSGPLELKSNVYTPLAAWVDKMIATAKPCWSGYRTLNKSMGK